MKSTLVILCVLFSATAVFSQNRQAAFAMNDRLGRGVNMGNSFEAPTETEWGNQWKPEYFKIMKDLGFRHVRLPVRWETTERSMSAAPYTISPTFLSRVKVVVDEALRNKLHIIINMHHHEALFADAAGQKERFLSQWSQIASYFKDYPDSLLFEVLNEPHGQITTTLWNQYFSEALAKIRVTNPTRVVLMGVADFGGLGSISALNLPNDEYIIVTPHYYNPFTFTHQGAEWVSGADPWLGTKWYDTEAERESVVSDFRNALAFSQTNKVPIHVGEFGAYSKADIDSRKRWTNFLARWFEEQHLSWAYWEFSAGFGVYNPTTRQFNTPLVNALLQDAMPPAVSVFPVAVYASSFSSGTDGWSMSQQGGASASVSASASKLNVTINSPGTETWHLQLVKNNVRLEKDKLYKLSFVARATSSRTVGFYAGKATSPWNSYSDVSAFSISSTEATYSRTFQMTSATDPAARLVFDLGRSTAGVTISQVKLEELSFEETVTSNGEEFSNEVGVYPNPVGNQLTVVNPGTYSHAALIDLSGRTIKTFSITPDATTLDVTSAAPGVYVMSFSGNGKRAQLRVMKK